MPDAEAQRDAVRPAPARFMVAAVCFISLVIAYCDRVNIAVAAPHIMAERHWSTVQMSWVLSGFFVGYASCLIPLGFLVQWMGAYRVLCCSIAGWSLFTLITPLPQSLSGMYCARLLLGAFESAIFPCINSLLASYFPRNEYAKAAGFCWSGGYAGPVLAFPLAAMILASLHWRSIFHIFGAAGFLWVLVCWKALRRPTPADCQPVGLSPAGEIAEGFKLLGFRQVWAVLILHFSSNWFIYLLLTWLPTYLVAARHFSGSLAAAGSALPFATALVGANCFALAISRFSRNRNRTSVRKAILPVFIAGAAIFTLIPLLQHSTAIVAALAVSTGLITAATPVYAGGSLELAPKSAGLLAGMQQAFANLAGIAAPLATGYLARTSWTLGFLAALVVCLVGAATYMTLGSAEPVYPEGRKRDESVAQLSQD